MKFCFKGNVFIFCPCSGLSSNQISAANSKSSSPEKNNGTQIIFDFEDLNNLHQLSELLFCENCCALRCDKCVRKVPVINYCPGCLTIVPKAEYTNNCCMRNCFTCPVCLYNLTISTSSTLGIDDSGILKKSFIFKCTKCVYRFHTGNSLGRAKSLSMFIRNQMSQTAYHEIFLGLVDEKNIKNNKIRRDKVIPKQETNLTHDKQEIPNYTDVALLRECNNGNNSICQVFNEEDDLNQAQRIQEVLSAGSFLTYNKYLSTQTQYSHSADMGITRIIHDNSDQESTYLRLYPVPKKLRSKKKIVCKLCENNIVEPIDSDLPQGLSKLLKSSDAVDYLPKLEVLRFLNELDTEITPNSRARFALTFRNPSYAYKMKLKVEVIEGKHNEHGIQVTIPYDSFELDEKFSILNSPDLQTKCETVKEKISMINKLENYIQFIPTIYLNKSTKQSRVELIKRGVDTPDDIFNNYDGNSKKLSENLLNRSFMSDDVNMSQESIVPNDKGVKPLDSGANWKSIAMNVYFSKVFSKIYLFDIPLLLNIECIDSESGITNRQYRSIYIVKMTVTPEK